MNWGTKIIIGLALFMVFIIAMATKMFFTSGEDELVDEDYYEKGLVYDRDYDLQKNAELDSVVPQFLAEKAGLTITFKSPANYKLSCQRPSDIKLDRLSKGTTGTGNQVFIPANVLTSGPWNLRLEFAIGGKEYLVQREIVMP
ncbi:nitrogen fixation protein FixH [Flavihumibacter sp. R14]|nr:nitrogen fixation protein FixH [Flavihumibacter soli]